MRRQGRTYTSELEQPRSGRLLEDMGIALGMVQCKGISQRAEPWLSDLKGPERSVEQGSLERGRYTKSCGAGADSGGDRSGRFDRIFTYGQIIL